MERSGRGLHCPGIYLSALRKAAVSLRKCELETFLIQSRSATHLIATFCGWLPTFRKNLLPFFLLHIWPTLKKVAVSSYEIFLATYVNAHCHNPEGYPLNSSTSSLHAFRTSKM
jgi:hypothetical protein